MMSLVDGWVKRVWREDVVLASEEKKNKNEWMCKNLDCKPADDQLSFFFLCLRKMFFWHLGKKKN